MRYNVLTRCKNEPGAKSRINIDSELAGGFMELACSVEAVKKSLQSTLPLAVVVHNCVIEGQVLEDAISFSSCVQQLLVQLSKVTLVTT
jgi:hypothetical protein